MSQKFTSEFTLRAAILGVILSVVMAISNVYLGLKVGLTVSASIPSSVLALVLLRWLKNSNVFESNLVQTAASAGESLAAGFIFTVPALLLLNEWQTVDWFTSSWLCVLGGIFGVVCSVPLRRLLIVREKLTFPEGVATAEILQTGYASHAVADVGVRALLFGSVLGAVLKAGEAILHLWKGALEVATITTRGILYFGFYASPALVGVGYIVGPAVSLTLFAGGAVSWLVVLPLLTGLSIESLPASVTPIEASYQLWSEHIRYVGVGGMVVGGVWTLGQLWEPLYRGFRARGGSELGNEGDLSRQTLGKLSAIAIAAIAVTFISFGATLNVLILLLTIYLVTAILFSGVSGYMAGLVGSSNNPISGLTIATVFLTAVGLLSLAPSFPLSTMLAVFVATLVCVGAAIAGDNLQDLKAGYMLGATPRHQQWMQLVGVVASAIAVPPVLSLLHKQFTVGSPELVAPQAGLVAGVLKGVFSGSLPWNYISIGIFLGVLAIAFEKAIQYRWKNFRFPVLGFAVGLYLPFALGATVMIGGLLRVLVSKRYPAKESHGVLFASGLITGEALLGVLAALLAALS